MASCSVLYPKGVKFNMDYYLKTHMPLVYKSWSSYGLQSWKVYEYGDDAAYKVQAELVFDSLDSFHKASGGPETAEVMADVPKFADKEPIFLAGHVTGTS